MAAIKETPSNEKIAEAKAIVVPLFEKTIEELKQALENYKKAIATTNETVGSIQKELTREKVNRGDVGPLTIEEVTLGLNDTTTKELYKRLVDKADEIKTTIAEYERHLQNIKDAGGKGGRRRSKSRKGRKSRRQTRRRRI